MYIYTYICSVTHVNTLCEHPLSVFQGSMDVMLGPSSSDFRLAAAQVADEFQRPLVSWSLPEIMGISFVRPAQSTVRLDSGG